MPNSQSTNRPHLLAYMCSISLRTYPAHCNFDTTAVSYDTAVALLGFTVQIKYFVVSTAMPCMCSKQAAVVDASIPGHRLSSEIILVLRTAVFVFMVCLVLQQNCITKKKSLPMFLWCLFIMVILSRQIRDHRQRRNTQQISASLRCTRTTDCCIELPVF